MQSERSLQQINLLRLILGQRYTATFQAQYKIIGREMLTANIFPCVEKERVRKRRDSHVGRQP